MITKILVGIGLVVIGISYISIGLLIAAFARAHDDRTLDRMWIGFNILITLFFTLFWSLIFIFFGVWVGIVALIYKLTKLTKKIKGRMNSLYF